MAVFGMLVALSLLGIQSCNLVTVQLSEWVLYVVTWLDENWTLAIPSRPFSGRIGMFLLIPLSMHWFIQCISQRRRRRLVWAALCSTMALATMFETMRHNLSRNEHWYHLKGWRGGWMVTDGFGACSWVEVRDSSLSLNVAANLGLEGPVNWNEWDGQQQASNEKWIQPPFDVWIHKKHSSQFTVRTPKPDQFNSILGDW